ncbi:hypothetical protein CGRA01v4_05085 [Colletotrichum graminicola]|nr:hypothetical protein CGRA01v4_05085 [Colletotrichum graminicola]
MLCRWAPPTARQAAWWAGWRGPVFEGGKWASPPLQNANPLVLNTRYQFCCSFTLARGSGVRYHFSVLSTEPLRPWNGGMGRYCLGNICRLQTHRTLWEGGEGARVLAKIRAGTGSLSCCGVETRLPLAVK